MDAVIFYDKPFLKFERLIETYYNYSPKGLLSFITALPIWIKKKLFFKNLIKKELQKVEKFSSKNLKLLFSEHHLSHAASAYFTSPFDTAAILTVDGVGEWATTTLFEAKENNIIKLKQNNFPHSVGLLYSSFTYFLGFKVNNGEYKLMGLAPYGNPNSKQTTTFINIIYEHLVKVFPDGSIWLNQKNFSFATSLKMIKDKKWVSLFNLEKRKQEAQINQAHCNLAYAIQKVIEDIIIRQIKHLKNITDTDNLCLAGGVALNCVANGKILDQNIFKNIFIQPAAGDAGGGIGAAFVAQHIYFKQNLENKKQYTPFLGPSYNKDDIRLVISKYNAVAKKTNANEIAQLLAEGNIIGRFSGKMEMGPRALGNRSILADPRNPDMQKRLNLKIKYRESFRPFAPVILKGKASEYFENCKDSPFMLFTFPLQKKFRYALVENYHELNLEDKCYFQRSTLPSITHVDFSARVQTVDKKNNPEFHQLLLAFEKITNCPLLINTSFNVRGEPIVCSPEDAFRCFMSTEMDYLILENYIFNKKEQTHSNTIRVSK